MITTILAALATLLYVAFGFVFWSKVIVGASTRDALEGCEESADFMAANAVDHPINLTAKLVVIAAWPFGLAFGVCVFVFTRLHAVMVERHS